MFFSKKNVRQCFEMGGVTVGIWQWENGTAYCKGLHSWDIMDIIYKCKYCILGFAINVVYFSLQIVLAYLFFCH